MRTDDVQRVIGRSLIDRIATIFIATLSDSDRVSQISRRTFSETDIVAWEVVSGLPLGQSTFRTFLKAQFHTGVGKTSISSEIFEGFFWKDVPVALLLQSRIGSLTLPQVEILQHTLIPFMAELSPHGWSLGIPGRTLFLVQSDVRLVYGGSTGSEIGLRSLDGKTTIGFFRSESLVALLRSFE